MQNMIAGTFKGKRCNLFFEIDHGAGRIHNLRATTGGYDAPRIQMSETEMADLVNHITYEVAEEVIIAIEAHTTGLVVAH